MQIPLSAINFTLFQELVNTFLFFDSKKPGFSDGTLGFLINELVPQKLNFL